MKKTPSLLLLLIFCLVSFQGYSQVKLGIQAGVNTSWLAHAVEDSNQKNTYRDATKFRAGYSVGVVAEKRLSNAFSLQSGLSWTNKGYKFGYEGESTNGSFELKNNITTNYLELPLNVAYSIYNFQIHAGPYVGVGILGGIRQRSSGIDNHPDFVKGKIKFRNTVTEADYQEANENAFVDFRSRLDYGLNIGIGYRTGSTLISSTYALGLANVYTKITGDEAAYYMFPNKGFNRVWSLSAAYFFVQ